MSVQLRIMSLVALGLLSAGFARGAELDTAIKELVEAHAKVKSYRATVKSSENVIFDNGNVLESNTTGKVEWMRKDDKLLYRAESESKSIQKVQGTETPMRAEHLMISDGEFFYTFIDVMGEKQAAKQLPNPVLGANAEEILAQLKSEYNLKLERDQEWGDAPCYVVEATPKKEDASELMAKALYYFRKDTGTAVRTIGFDAKGNKTYTIEHFDVERNPTLDPERFEFKLPDGVRLQDMTNP